MSRFEGKVALVTGGASGIGAAVGRKLVDEGASVVLLDLNADGVASVATSLGDTAVGVAGNVAQEDDVAGAVALAVERFGQLDIAFNIAGIARIGTIVDGPT